jgi:hypothetical protein
MCVKKLKGPHRTLGQRVSSFYADAPNQPAESASERATPRTAAQTTAAAPGGPYSNGAGAVGALRPPVSHDAPPPTGLPWDVHRDSVEAVGLQDTKGVPPSGAVGVSVGAAAAVPESLGAWGQPGKPGMGGPEACVKVASGQGDPCLQDDVDMCVLQICLQVHPVPSCPTPHLEVEVN